jgi:hypothetical protein
VLGLTSLAMPAVPAAVVVATAGYLVAIWLAWVATRQTVRPG